MRLSYQLDTVRVVMSLLHGVAVSFRLALPQHCDAAVKGGVACGACGKVVKAVVLVDAAVASVAQLAQCETRHIRPGCLSTKTLSTRPYQQRPLINKV